MVIIQCACIFLFLALGELIVWLTGIPIPSCIIGMLLLAFSLHFKLLRLRYVEGVADFLVKNLGFFFVPAGVALMCHFNLIREQWFPIVVSASASTVIVIAVTGHFHQIIRKRFSSHRRHHGVSRR